jgi:hypothetical protein
MGKRFLRPVETIEKLIEAWEADIPCNSCWISDCRDSNGRPCNLYAKWLNRKPKK